MEMKTNLKIKQIRNFILLVLSIILINVVVSKTFFRIDLTSDKRYTLSNTTKEILKNVDQPVFIQVYLDGELPYGFNRFKKAIEELLYEYKVLSGGNISFQFIDPYKVEDENQRKDFFKDLSEYGIEPVNIRLREKGGNYSEKIVYPGAVVNVGKKKTSLNLLRNNQALTAEVNLNLSIEGLEYEFTRAVKQLLRKEFPFIAFIEGHGELDEYQTADITSQLSEFYNIDRVIINGQLGILDVYDAIIIAQPKEKFPERDKFVIDQYVMNGGNILWLIDQVQVSMDSLAKGNTTLSLIKDLNLSDLLFKYHIRINPVLVQDIQCAQVPVNMALAGQSPKWVPAPWLYSPIIAPSNDHVITKGLNLLQTEFINYIDVIGGDDLVKKEILLSTSPYSRIVKVPALISLGDINKMPKEEEFNQSHLNLGVLIENEFTSAFENRIVNQYYPGQKVIDFKTKGSLSKMIVIADGDMIRNEVQQKSQGILILPLGRDKYSNQLFGNREFIKNCINYLCGEEELMNLKSREFVIRLLDKTKITAKRSTWQLFNLLFPVALIVLIGLSFVFIQKRKFSRK